MPERRPRIAPAIAGLGGLTLQKLVVGLGLLGLVIVMYAG